MLLNALTEINDSLAKIVGYVCAVIETISFVLKKIASRNTDLSSRTDSQASSLLETASLMAELTLTVKNTDNVRQVNLLVISTTGEAVKGGMVVGQVVNTMGSIKDSSRKIVDIIGVIDGIAF